MQRLCTTQAQDLARLPIPTCRHTDLHRSSLQLHRGPPHPSPLAYCCPLILSALLGERSSKKPSLTVGVSGTLLIVVLAMGYHCPLQVCLPPP